MTYFDQNYYSYYPQDFKAGLLVELLFTGANFLHVVSQLAELDVTLELNCVFQKFLLRLSFTFQSKRQLIVVLILITLGLIILLTFI